MLKQRSRMWLGASAILAGLTAASASAQVQSFSVTGGAPTPSDNDFTRINDAVQAAGNGATITLEGDFDWSEANAMASYTASQSAQQFGYTWNQTPITGIIAPSGVSGVTIEAHTNGASVTGFASTDTRPGNTHGASQTYPAPDLAFIYFGEGNTDGWTVDGLVLRDFERAITLADAGTPGSAHNITIQNCTIDVSNWWVNMGVGIALRGGQSNNLTIDGNRFEFIINSGNAVTQGGLGYVLNGIRADSGGNETLRGGVIDNNEFVCVFDPSAPIQDVAASLVIAIDENSGSSQGSLSISNNTFDGRIPDGQGGYMSGAWSALRLGKDYNPGTSDPVYDGNTFINYLRCFEARFNPGGGVETLVFTNATFTDCGWAGPGIAPGFDPLLNAAPGTTGSAAPNTLEYQPAIANASGTIYSAAGGYDVRTDLAINWDGLTGIPALNALSLEPRGFEMISDGIGGWAQAGILTADIVAADAPGTIYNRTEALSDTAWKFTDRWARPTPPEDDLNQDLTGVELAFGYNAFADPIDPGDPTFLQGVSEYVLTADEEFPVGTIIDTDITIRSDTPGTVYTITPKTKSLAAALFLVDPNVMITLQDVVVSGNNPNISGIIEARSAVELTDTTSGVEVIRSTLTNFIGGCIRTYSQSSVSITDSILKDSGYAVNAPGGNAPSVMTVSNSKFSNFVTNGFLLNSGGGANPAASFTGNVFDAANAFFFQRTPDTLTMTGNLFPQGGAIEFSIGNAYGAGTTVDISGNWYSNIYGDPATEVTGGVITGNVDVGSADNDIVGGTRLRDAGQAEVINETGIIAFFDADLDAWPDAFELATGSTTLWNSFDTDNDGWPDGVEAAEGTDPNNGGDSPAGTFVIDEDLDNNGIVDWYEDALAANTGLEVFLGDVLRNNGVGLSDAVRGLQIVNGGFAKNQEAGDINALDVTGLGGSSLANPLQVLRFQATVRDGLPALPGIN